MSWGQINEHLKDLTRENEAGLPIPVEARQNNTGGKGKGKQETHTSQQVFLHNGQNAQTNPVKQLSQGETIDLTKDDEDMEEVDDYDYMGLLNELRKPGEKVSPAGEILGRLADTVVEALKIARVAYENDDFEKAREARWVLGYELTTEDIQVLMAKYAGGKGNAGGASKGR